MRNLRIDIDLDSLGLGTNPDVKVSGHNIQNIKEAEMALCYIYAEMGKESELSFQQWSVAAKAFIQLIESFIKETEDAVIQN